MRRALAAVVLEPFEVLVEVAASETLALAPSLDPRAERRTPRGERHSLVRAGVAANDAERRMDRDVEWVVALRHGGRLVPSEADSFGGSS